MKEASVIKVVLFDLGNVLVDLGDKAELNEMLGTSNSEADVWVKWLNSPIVKRFDSGMVSFDTFANQMTQDVPTLGEVDVFKTRFSNWPKGLFDGALDLVREVKPQCHKAVLSNTNSAHWPRLMVEMKLGGVFQSYFASHQMGLVKPEKEVYAYVIESLNVAPEEILFIDDNLINVEAARMLGVIAHQAKGVNETKNILIKYNIV
ncbi:HAD family hydrolase [Marinomonas sp. 2405UD68-3]|uniref:HAD family hydrolase n=1 Tax=Marinomonas sp. 2405UD68-3 TaxID=3391835 RepID=UPI0039C9AACC